MRMAWHSIASRENIWGTFVFYNNWNPTKKLNLMHWIMECFWKWIAFRNSSKPFFGYVFYHFFWAHIVDCLKSTVLSDKVTSHTCIENDTQLIKLSISKLFKPILFWKWAEDVIDCWPSVVKKAVNAYESGVCLYHGIKEIVYAVFRKSVKQPSSACLRFLLFWFALFSFFIKVVILKVIWLMLTVAITRHRKNKHWLNEDKCFYSLAENLKLKWSWKVWSGANLILIISFFRFRFLLAFSLVNVCLLLRTSYIVESKWKNVQKRI